MENRQRKSSPNPHSGRFLKPGALARLRDSKIAKSGKSTLVLRFPAAAAQAVEQTEFGAHQLRFVSCRVSSGPRYLRRKKLVASKCVYFVPPSPSSELADAFVDMGFGFGSEISAVN